MLLLSGCSHQGNSASPQDSGSGRDDSKHTVESDQRVVQAWDQFVSEVKSRVASAQNAWLLKHENGLLEVSFIRDDVKPDAGRGVMMGEIQFNTSEYSILSYKNILPGGGYGKAVGQECEYELRFRYSDGSWLFKDGRRKRSKIGDKSDTDTSGVENLNEGRYFHLKALFQP